MDVLRRIVSSVIRILTRVLLAVFQRFRAGFRAIFGGIEAQRLLRHEILELALQNEVRRRERHVLSRSNELLEEKINDIQNQLCAELEWNGPYLDGSATPSPVQSTLNSRLELTLYSLRFRVYELAMDFIILMERHGVDHKQALRAHFRGIYLTRPAHIKFLLEAWIYSTLFEDFENDSFLPGGPTLFFDSNQRQRRSYADFLRILAAERAVKYSVLECDSGTFWRRKLRSFLAMWQSVLISNQGQTRRGDLFFIEDNFSMADLRYLEPTITKNFIRAFLSAASYAWALHKLCHSFEPCARICRVQEGAEFKDEYMTSVLSKDEDPKFLSEVEFMIRPGFRVRKSVDKCQIYPRGDPLFISLR